MPQNHPHKSPKSLFFFGELKAKPKVVDLLAAVKKLKDKGMKRPESDPSVEGNRRHQAYRPQGNHRRHRGRGADAPGTCYSFSVKYEGKEVGGYSFATDSCE